MNILIRGTPTRLLIGMDAEFFLKKDGKYIAASAVIPGKKHEPHKLEHGVCHPDGLSLEVGAPPAETPEGMIQNLFKVLQEVKEKYLDPAGVTIAYAMEVKADTVTDVQKEDLDFGCGVEFDVLSGDMIKHVNRGHNTHRYSGFHIHLGFTEGQEVNYFTFKDMCPLIRELDTLFSALPTKPERSNQYGGFGAFRIKPYGVEYRMMDCTVITDKNKLQTLLGKLNELPSVFERLSKGVV